MTGRAETPARLLMGTEHACGYLPGRQARSAFIDPTISMDPVRYGALLDLGFRRSGRYVYRPMCRGCDACRSVRVPVGRFHPDRSQRRCLAHNDDLRVARAERLLPEHFRLYQSYLRTRHADGGMDPDDADAFQEFFSAGWSQTLFWEARANGRLVAVAVLDRVPGGLSAVYTFYDPDQPHRGLGTWMILREIEVTRASGLRYLYLGYWVAGSAKMDYKSRFQPLEVLGTDGRWALLER